jgi:hypothetical protein
MTPAGSSEPATADLVAVAVVEAEAEWDRRNWGTCFRKHGNIGIDRKKESQIRNPKSQIGRTACAI